MNIDLSNKNAVVCGSTKGIGRAIALQFAACGANVVLVARNEESLRKVLRELSASKKQNHNFIVADFSDPESLKVKIQNFISEHPPVHILVNNTGGPKGGEILHAETTEFENTFRNHLVCNQIMVQALWQGMKKEKYGRIINIISTSVKQPIKNLGVSNTIRAAVANWSKTLSVELAPFGTTVNNILPGATKTERLYSIFEARAKASGRSVEEIAKDWLVEIPAGRFAEPEEPAYAAAFLASPLASYINGINIPVDGGRLNCL
ncbi:MAG: SDR family oxidoreductase [Ignavibacteria bacterium]|nr:SDR family oxidoreductase [Ignavibacteria bacterium]MCC7158971.1 SDR family oxidoreductase [Ignavibacteria bacterium]